MEAVLETTILGKVKEAFVSTLKLASGKLDVDAEFDTLGIDSIIAMELMKNLSDKLGISLTPAHFTSVKNVRELAEYIDGNLVSKDGVREPGAAAAKKEAPPERPQASPARPAKPRSAAGPARKAAQPLQGVAEFIGRKYAIDLGQRRFASLEEIAEALVTEHADRLLSHYGLGEGGLGEGGPGEAGLGETESGAPEDFPEGGAGLAGADARPSLVGDIAIVGIGCRFPDAPDPRRFWNNLMGRKNSMREVPSSRWNWEEHYRNPASPLNTVSKWAALVEDVDCFDPGFFGIPPAEAALMDPQERLVLQEAYNAFLDAGIDPAKLRGSKTGVFIGYEYAEYEQFLRQNRSLMGTPLPYTSSSPSYYLANRLSFVFDFRGPSESINMSCASSALAVNRAYASLLAGESDLAVAGGVCLNLFAEDYAVLSRLGVLSPDGTCAVFDDGANGYTRGEGAGVVVLKRLADAERDNNRIYGVIKSCHQAHKGGANFISEIKHESITGLLDECYGKAGIRPETVRYIEVDGYATKWGDSFEFEGIKNAFRNAGAKGKYCALGSLKGNIGHLEPASGIAGLIKLALSLHHKKFPATISKRKTSTFIDIDNASHPLYIMDHPLEFDALRDAEGTPIRVGLNSFADTGVNVHILLEESPSRSRSMAAMAAEKAPAPQLVVLSARNRDRLRASIQGMIDFLSASDASLSIPELAYSLQVGREAMEERLALIVSTAAELLEKLESAGKAFQEGEPGMENRGFFYGNEQARKNVLANLIGGEILERQVELSLLQGQWKPIALLWVNGVAVPWDKIWEGRTVRQAPLPGYPFAKERHWVDFNAKDASGAVPGPRLQPGAPAAPANGSFGEDLPVEWIFRLGGGDVPGESLAPSLKVELFLKQEIGRKLGKQAQAVDVDADYLELGLDSMAIGDFIAKTNQLLHVNVAPSVVFKHPNVRGFSEYLAATYPEKVAALEAARADGLSPGNGHADGGGVPVEVPGAVAAVYPLQDILIPMQTAGGGIPIFAVPGADGSALSLQQLCLALGDRQPFYGLEAVGLDGRTAPLWTLEETAEAYIAAMQAAIVQGPVTLLGYSNGGTVAFEMARRLVEGGADVAALLLVDGLCPTRATADFEESMVEICRMAMGRIGKVLDLTVGQLKAVPEERRREYLFTAMTGQGLELPEDQFTTTYNVLSASERSYRAYVPSRLPRNLNVVLFKSTRGFPGAPADYGWNEFLAAPLRAHEIEADHFSIIDKGPCREIAKRIHALARSGAPRIPTAKTR